MRTEEGRFVRSGLTYADPDDPDPGSPSTLRAHYPRFTPFGTPITLTAERIIKTSRAIDPWGGSLAVFGRTVQELAIWGVVDQRVHFNLSLNSEPGGFVQPGLFTAIVDGIGQISVFHDRFFLGGLRYEELIRAQVNAIYGKLISRKVIPYHTQLAKLIRGVLEAPEEKDIIGLYYFEWSRALRRICVGIQRAGTGGTILITPNADHASLSRGSVLHYQRLREALVGSALQELYYLHLASAVMKSESVSHDDVRELLRAQEDRDDRTREVTGAVRLLSSICTLDGAVVLTPDLALHRFGVKINSSTKITKAYDGESLGKGGNKLFDFTKHGTRHLSVLRYCKDDPDALGVVVSQDGAVRLVTSFGRKMVVYDDIRVRSYSNNVQQERDHDMAVRSWKKRLGQQQGFSKMPKSIEAMELLVQTKRMPVANIPSRKKAERKK